MVWWTGGLAGAGGGKRVEGARRGKGKGKEGGDDHGGTGWRTVSPRQRQRERVMRGRVCESELNGRRADGA